MLWNHDYCSKGRPMIMSVWLTAPLSFMSTWSTAPLFLLNTEEIKATQKLC